MQNSFNLSELLNRGEQEIYPILGPNYRRKDCCKINLSVNNPALIAYEVQRFEALERYIAFCLQAEDARIGMGGYLEQRLLYQQSQHFKSSVENRCIHLGIDLWAPMWTAIFAPIDGKIHSFRYNDKVLDYGATIILTHQIQGQSFYSLYGHLSLNSLDGLYKGKIIEKGTNFAEMGPPSENGGWVPHLHFQLILDMMNMEGDFVGVVSKDDVSKYQQICPDPASLIVFAENAVK